MKIEVFQMASRIYKETRCIQESFLIEMRRECVQTNVGIRIKVEVEVDCWIGVS